MNAQNHHGGGAPFDRDRELDEQRHRAMQQQQQQQEEMAHREREQAERQHREQQFQTPAPHHSNAASLPLHQPVAARMPTIHSPGGLLANHGGSAPSIPLGGPPASAAPPFGGPLHNDAGRAPPHGGPPVGSGPQHQIFAPIPHGPGGPNGAINGANGASSLFGGPLQQEAPRGGPPEAGRALQHMPFPPGVSGAPPPMPAPGMPAAAAAGGLPQGQQPILNDALSYLDQVKVQFHEQPDVYNRFLDIMKDFKSQTIDTPGVISRVSELFAGHPNLIQGFNTFLPPGYRIECGLENNPNSIRVTTPSGSTIHSIGGGRNSLPEPPQTTPGSGQPAFGGQRPGGWQQQPPQQVQHSVESPEANFSVPAGGPPAPFPGPGSSQAASFDGSSPNQPRAVPASQNGSAATHPPVPRTALTPTPAAAQNNINGHSAQQANMEKRGPVEFNHAISYVNKIKNRFQDKPEIYKQFLEILQTYQREQKPIQDVYSQVTTLFHAAPDLLEDFKQFLPESAAQTRSANAARIEEMGLSAATPTPQPGQPARDGPKMPPVGNFAPPASATKESKKRPRPDKSAPVVTGPGAEVQTSALRGTLPGASTSNKRAKLSHKTAADGPSVEPTLTPVMPEPLNPTPPAHALQEDLAFFERVKKHIGNRTTMLEFIKLINLYTQDLITTEVLVHKASQFIGGNHDLMNTFKNMMNYYEGDDKVENRPEPPTGRVSLSNCRGYGPSYRLLPKRERLRPCSGRDELCNSVLNDEWASHPTWASEDSGFVAHRKNGYEEGLHRIEEERHDYDFYIEANQKCIQLLEPIAQQMLTLPPAERATFKIPPGLGGQSTSIYKRVLKKIYGDKGPDVVNEMFNNPFSVVPIVMARLKQKDEEWRFTQREWEKVWQAQSENMHLKSLDHMGIQVKSNDKRNLSQKHLVDVIKTKHEEQKRARLNKGKTPRYQFLHDFDDQSVLLDLLRFMVLYANVSGQHNALERRRILEFFETFIPQFFDIPEDLVRERLAEMDQDSAEEEEDDAPPPELTNGRSSRRNGKRADLLRGVLDPGRNGSRSRTQKEGSAASGSKETTPEAGSGNDEDMPDAEDANLPEVSNDRWLPMVPRPTIFKDARNGRDDADQSLLDADGELKADAPFKRSWYNFYCNQSIFVFFSVFQALYKRLVEVKNSTKTVVEEIRREKAEKPAKALGIARDDLHFFDDIEDPENNTDKFWPRTVELVEDFINGETDEARYQDILRHYYLKTGWKIYNIQDHLKTLCRIGLSCNNPDSKGEKTKELVREYLASRQQEETSYQTEISARKFAEKCIKDGEMFVICWYPAKKEATVRWLQKDETTFYTDEMEKKEQWQYYISSYMRIEHTEGVVRSRLQKVLLERNLPSGTQDASDDGYVPKPVVVHEGLVLRICLLSYKIVYEKGTSDYFIYNTSPQASALKEGEEPDFQEEKQVFMRELREERFREKMVMNSPWMKNLSQDRVQQINEEYQRWKDEGPAAVGLVEAE